MKSCTFLNNGYTCLEYSETATAIGHYVDSYINQPITYLIHTYCKNVLYEYIFVQTMHPDINLNMFKWKAFKSTLVHVYWHKLMKQH